MDQKHLAPGRYCRWEKLLSKSIFVYAKLISPFTITWNFTYPLKCQLRTFNEQEGSIPRKMVKKMLPKIPSFYCKNDSQSWQRLINRIVHKHTIYKVMVSLVTGSTQPKPNVTRISKCVRITRHAKTRAFIASIVAWMVVSQPSVSHSC